MARMVWNPVTRDFEDTGSGTPRGKRSATSGKVRCGEGHEHEELWMVCDGTPPCPSCGGPTVAVAPSAKEAWGTVAVHAKEILPGGGYNLNGTHVTTRAEESAVLRLHGATRDHTFSESRQAVESRVERIWDQQEANRREAGYTTADADRVNAERKEALARGDTTSDLVTKSTREILTGA